MNILQDITFLNPEYFWGIILIPVILYFFYKRLSYGINFLNFADLKKVYKNNNYKFYLSIILLGLILLNFIVIFANPNKVNISEKVKKNGIDIVIALDVSGSMEANDLKPNRLEAAKNVIDGFLKKMQTDRVGLVVFAGKPFTSIPLTFDYNILSETLKNLSTETINQQKRGLSGTAIGDAILMSKTLFKSKGDKKDENREKVIILLTDGDANVGVDPKIAALSAKEDGIKIYTIGIGSKSGGYITYNVGGFVQRQKIPPLNDRDLKYIAQVTSGEYFRADNNRTFEAIFNHLQKLEKNDIEVELKKRYSQKYDIFIYSLVFLMILFFFFMINNVEMSIYGISKKKKML